MKLISAVSPRGDIKFATFEGRMNRDRFAEFIQKLRTDAGRPIIVIADNAKYHKEGAVKRYLQPTEAGILVAHLPTCSPELNPDEQVWNHLKRRLGKVFLESKELLNNEVGHTMLSIQQSIALVRSFFEGQIIDAAFVAVPRQRNPRADNAQIKTGEAPADWAAKPAKARQKDVDTRWARKGEERHFGYKNHVKVDSKSKLITAFTVTDAAVHDSDALAELVAPGDLVAYVDRAYVGPRCAAVFERNEVEAKFIELPCRNRPLAAGQKWHNRAKSRVRVRVEHVFRTIKMSLRARWKRCIGQVRNAAAITLTNLVHNLVRFEQMERLELRTW